LHPVKHHEVVPYDKPPDSRALMNFWVTLGKETEAFAVSDNQLTQLARG
jgi:hypothetical protein